MSESEKAADFMQFALRQSQRGQVAPMSSEVRGEVASPLTYAKTAKIRGGGYPPC